MNRLRRHCVAVTAGSMLTCLLASASMAQLQEARKLDDQFAALYAAHKCAEAIPLAEQALALFEEAEGPDSTDVAHGAYNLAACYVFVGRHADAEPMFKRAQAIWEKAHDFDFMYALMGLASLYTAQERYPNAEAMYQRMLAIDEQLATSQRTNKSIQLQIARVLAALAHIYEMEARVSDTEPLYTRALAILSSAGAGQTEYGNVLARLGDQYRVEGRYADAEPLEKQALAIEEKANGPNAPEIGAVLNELASLYFDQARYADAEPLYKRALTIAEKALAYEDTTVAIALGNLARLYTAEDRAEAEPLYKRALAIEQNKLSPDQTQLGSILNGLSQLYRQQGRYADAEPLAKQAVAIWEKSLRPDHPAIALAINVLAELYNDQGRYDEAEPLYRRALTVREKAVGAAHPLVAASLNNLAILYGEQHRYADALPLIQRTIAQKAATAGAALPILFGAQAVKLLTAEEAFDNGLNVTQHAQQTAAGDALNALAVRFSAGNDRLAGLVRKDQDLANEAAVLDKAILATVSKQQPQNSASNEQKVRDRIAAIAKERNDLGKVFARDFPDYAALSKPEPLTAKDIQGLLAADEALVIVSLGAKKSYVWAITHGAAAWKELPVTAQEMSKTVSGLRDLLDFHSIRPFDAQASFNLYQKILGPVADLLTGKPRLSFVLNGALTSLPPQLLVTRDPAGKALKNVDWLIRTHAVTVLPSVASLKVLRGKSAIADAVKPLIGFGDPVFGHDPKQLAQNTRVAADVTAARGIRGTIADIAELKTALPPLPDTATELREVAASVHADRADIILGAAATETRVKQEKLDRFRIVYFATHGLLAGDVAEFAKLNAKPALVLSLPKHPTEADDGLLTASEVAQLKLNADWVVLSACNTAAAETEKPGAEALSGLARAFFYAGARSLVVSNWEVDTKSAVTLMTGTFAALAADPKLSHAEALQKSILAMIGDAKHPEWADPKYWAPFVVVGEPAKPAN
jgi:CHAT domain-containing protein